jgi:hypothetical protein
MDKGVLKVTGDNKKIKATEGTRVRRWLRKPVVQNIGLRNPFTWRLKSILNSFCEEKSCGVLGLKTISSNKWHITLAENFSYKEDLLKFLLCNNFVISAQHDDVLEVNRLNISKKLRNKI